MERPPGGTREKALEYAAQLCGPAWRPDLNVEAAVLPIADVFQQWLDHEPVILTGLDYDHELAARLREAFAAIMEARVRSGHKVISDVALTHIRVLADDLDGDTELADG